MRTAYKHKPLPVIPLEKRDTVQKLLYEFEEFQNRDPLPGESHEQFVDHYADYEDKIATAREEARPQQELIAELLHQNVQRFLTVGIVCGKHWDNMPGNTRDAFQYARSTVRVNRTINVHEGCRGIPDWIILNVAVAYDPVYARVSYDLRGVARLLKTKRVQANLGPVPYAHIGGDFQGHFFHLNLCLGNANQDEWDVSLPH